jgi:hypothetical protein
MNRKLTGLGVMAASALLFSGIGAAHHGAGAYDTSQTTTVSGKISNFRFVNPHVLIYANVEAADGTVVEWSGELTSPNRLARGRPTQTSEGVAWSKTILQPGDEVTLMGNPARNGAPSLRLLKVVKIVNGQELLLVDDES